MADIVPSLSRMSKRQMSQSLRNSFSREVQHVLTLSLLRSMLPDGWDCPGENGHGIQSGESIINIALIVVYAAVTFLSIGI